MFVLFASVFLRYRHVIMCVDSVVHVFGNSTSRWLIWLLPVYQLDWYVFCMPWVSAHVFVVCAHLKHFWFRPDFKTRSSAPRCSRTILRLTWPSRNKTLSNSCFIVYRWLVALALKKKDFAVLKRVPRNSTHSLQPISSLQTQSLPDVCHELPKGWDGLDCAVTTDPRNIATDSIDDNIEMKCQVSNKHIPFQLWGAGLLQQQCKNAYIVGIALCTLAARNKRRHCPCQHVMHLAWCP